MKHIPSTALLFTAVLGLFSGPSRRAEACAAVPVSASGQISAEAQRIFIASRGNKTEVVIQVTVPRTPEDYGVLIPVPVQPQIDSEPVNTSELDQLDQATGVSLVDNSLNEDSGGFGCGDARALNGGGDRVDLIDSVAIGPLQAVVLTTTAGASALTSWLSNNGFVLPSGSEAVIDRYVDRGWYWIAARRSNTATGEAPSSVGVHFTLDGEQLAIPLPIAQIGAADRLVFTVFAVSSTPMEPLSSYAKLGLGDLNKTTARESGYGSAIEQAVSAKSGRAFVIESANPVSNGALSGKLAAIAGSSGTITRLTTVTEPSALTEDLTLFGGEAPAVNGVLDVTPEEEDGGCSNTGRSSSVLLWALALIVVLRRRANA